MCLICLMLTFAAWERPAEITEIRLERTPCFGRCPVDEVVLRPDGTAAYNGKWFVDKIGRYEGTFDPAEFEELAKRMESSGFFDLKDRYDKPITDHPSRITTAKRGDESKRVVNYADSGPDELRDIEEEILRVMKSIAWKEAGR